MLRQVQKNKSRKMITKHLLFALALTFIVGCTYNGMTEIDKQYQDSGYILHCTEMAGDNCLTRQWFNETQNTYQRFHNGTSINGTNSSDN